MDENSLPEELLQRHNHCVNSFPLEDHPFSALTLQYFTYFSLSPLKKEPQIKKMYLAINIMIIYYSELEHSYQFY